MLYLYFNTIFLLIISIVLTNLNYSDYFNVLKQTVLLEEKLHLSVSFIFKEIVHPQVHLRIPCDDLSPVSSSTMGPLITRGTSDITTSHALTGGEYKTQEHIHRNISDLRLLAIPTSWSRVADSNPDWDVFSRLVPPRGFTTLCLHHCIMCVAPDVKAMLIWRHPHLPPC